jgi:hypothetical protein
MIKWAVIFRGDNNTDIIRRFVVFQEDLTCLIVTVKKKRSSHSRYQSFLYIT